MVDEGVRLAGAGLPADATALFQLAADACPASAAPWREMAGLHALRDQWTEAAADARAAIAREPSDQHAWRILATSLYLSGDEDGALGAWNEVGQGRIDLIDVKGLARTRYAVALRAIGLQPNVVLTPALLRTARRRLAELPSAEAARIAYRPGPDGRVRVDAVVLERPLAPTSPIALAATGLRALTDRELAIAVSSPTGGGEVWSASWRWYEHRPRVAAGFAAPAPFGGTWSVRGIAERESFAVPDAGGGFVEERRRGATFAVSDWTRTGLRWEVGAGADHWRGDGRSVSLSARAEQRLPGEWAVVEARIGAWTGGLRTWTAGVGAEWRSTPRHEGDVFIARAGTDLAGRGAPFMLWPGAGTGQARDVLLRAHPLLDDGIVTGGAFGRTLAHGGAEWRRWSQLRGKPLIRFAPALFVDMARAGRGQHGADGRLHLDAGAGIRFVLPGSGVVRVDLAKGLRDGRTALSIDWTR
jgi:hypothetical protein